jgi:uncharacterized protein YlxP (DUF503 family)
LFRVGWSPSGHNGGMWVGWIEFDLLLGAVGSLKEKRSVVRPLVAEIRRRFEVSVAEVDHLDLHRRSVVGASLVSNDSSHVTAVLDGVERLVAGRPEVELLSARRALRTSDD